MSETVFSGLIIGVLAMLFFTPYCMSIGISKLGDDVTMQERILCAIPIFNIIRAELKYYGRIGFATIGNIFLIIMIAVRCVFILVLSVTSPIVGNVTLILLWVSLALYVISQMVFVYNVINDAQVTTTGKRILMSIFYPFGQYYVGNYLANVMKHLQEKQETFKQ